MTPYRIYVTSKVLLVFENVRASSPRNAVRKIWEKAAFSPGEADSVEYVEEGPVYVTLFAKDGTDRAYDYDIGPYESLIRHYPRNTRRKRRKK
jgi:hypothetical protein